jgi:TolB-like protein
MSDASRAVFLSYASQDAEAAKKICGALRAAGIEVWFDQNDLVGGDAWDAKIRKQIAECALFVPIISASTQTRLEGYFRLEWKLAAQRTHTMADEKPFLLPIVIDATRDHDAKVPAEFRTVQWTWLPGGATPGALAERVQRLVAGPAEAQARSHGVAPPLERAPVAPPREENFWVAVLPFKHRGGDADLAALAEGVTDGVVSGLAKFLFLRVIANSATARYAHEAVDVRSAGRELGARYVMEGSLRQSGGKLRATVQLVDATSGAHIWAQHYDRPYSVDAMFDLQDDLVARIVATVADADGVLVHSMAESVRRRDIAELTPHEAFIRLSGFGMHYTPDEHAALRTAFERLVEQAPEKQGECWAALSLLYFAEYSEGFNPLPDPLARAAVAAQRAATACPTSSFAHYTLARSLFTKGEFGAFRTAADRAIALNPFDSVTMALLSILFSYAGDWDRAGALVKRAQDLNPHHPGWYWFPESCDAYRRGDYRAALDVALKINLPGYYWTHVLLAACYAQLGQTEAATKALHDLLQVRPGFAAIARVELSKNHRPEFVEHLLAGLRKAGLESEEAAAS